MKKRNYAEKTMTDSDKLKKHLRQFRGTEMAAIAGTYIDEGFLKELRDGAIPSAINAQIKKAQKYGKRNSIIRPLVDTIIYFGRAGFHNWTDDEKAKKFYDGFCRTYNMDGIVRQLWKHMARCDNAVLHWKLKNPQQAENGKDATTSDNIEYIMSLDPELCEIITMFGKAVLYVEPDQEMKKWIIKPHKSEAEQKRLKDLPEKWIKAAQGQGTAGHAQQVMLSETDGEYFKAINVEMMQDRFIEPSMCAIFFDISILNLLIDGDAQIAEYVKKSVLHVSAGESRREGDRKNWMKQKDLNALQQHFESLSAAIRIYTQHHVKLNFISPDINIFRADKYEAVLARIFGWAGVSKGLILGEGGNYASQYLNLKRLIAKILDIRLAIKREIEAFYMLIRPTDPNKKYIAEEKVPKVHWDEQMLKEPKQLLAEAKTGLQLGTLSGESFNEDTNHSDRIEQYRKKKEAENPKSRLPLYEPGQGMALLAHGIDPKQGQGKTPKEGEPGRPTTKKHNSDPDQQTPRPSTASIDDEIAFIEEMQEFMLEGAPFATMPAACFKLWERVYRERRKAGASARSAARQAYAAIKKAGWRKDPKTGKWTKSKATENMSDTCPTTIAILKDLGIDTADIDWEEIDKAAKYEPPKAGKDAPQGVKDILDKVYNSCRKEHPGEDPEWKTRCSKIAWHAVKMAGWVKNKTTGKWTKKKK